MTGKFKIYSKNGYELGSFDHYFEAAAAFRHWDQAYYLYKYKKLLCDKSRAKELKFKSRTQFSYNKPLEILP